MKRLPGRRRQQHLVRMGRLLLIVYTWDELQPNEPIAFTMLAIMDFAVARPAAVRVVDSLERAADAHLVGGESFYDLYALNGLMSQRLGILAPTQGLVARGLLAEATPSTPSATVGLTITELGRAIAQRYASSHAFAIRSMATELHQEWRRRNPRQLLKTLREKLDLATGMESRPVMPFEPEVEL